MRKLILFSFVLASFLSVGQEFEVPTDYEMKEIEEINSYNDEIIECVEWLRETPADEQVEKRQEAYEFFLKWVAATPAVTLEIHAEMIKFSKKNPDLLVIYMGAWAVNALENPEYKKDIVTGNVVGLSAVVDFYQKNPSLKKDSFVKKLAKLKEKGELEDWVKKALKV